MIQRKALHKLFRDVRICIDDLLKQRDRLYRLAWRDKTGLVTLKK